MKSILMLLLRTSTGALLVIWGLVKAMSPESAIGVSNKYYGGLISAEALQPILGWAQVALGVLVILGLLRKVVYPIQALVLVVGALAIWQYLVDPLGLYLLDEESRRLLFFPSTTVAVASLILIAFKSYDTIALDEILFRN